jgi:hypothetical protein
MTTFQPPLDQRFPADLSGLFQRMATMEQQLNQITRASLGLGGAAVLSVGATAGTVAAGDDSRVTGAAALLSAIASSASKPCTSTLTLTTTVQDVAGCTLTFTLAGAHGFALVVGTFDFQPTATSAGNIAIGALMADAATQSQQVIWSDNGANSRGTLSQSWVVPLAAGSHTLKLRASKVASGGTHVANSSHTNLSVLVVDLV